MESLWIPDAPDFPPYTYNTDQHGIARPRLQCRPFLHELICNCQFQRAYYPGIISVVEVSLKLFEGSCAFWQASAKVGQGKMGLFTVEISLLVCLQNFQVHPGEEAQY